MSRKNTRESDNWDLFKVSSYRFHLQSETDLHYIQSEIGKHFSGYMHANGKVVMPKARTMNKLILIISELGTNILKYACKGDMIISLVSREGILGIKVDAFDKGPGIVNEAGALTDHFSTGLSLGLGLPAVKRLANWFLLHSEPGKGTRVQCVLLLE